MSPSAASRIENERQHPRLVDLWFALQPLRTTVRFMNTGAHPDDETSAMLAALGVRDGINLSYACANRGEGGQNDIGTQMTETLGALRTREMERAADVLNMRLYWLSETADDQIFDFGFSKSGVETLGKWGRARTLKRFVDIIRTEQPDIICPTFLDIPGQHGHHRAMTEAAHLVMDLAADPGYTDSPLEPWKISKLYLPAWSGAGQAYDDDLPPPPTSLVIDAKGRDPVTNWSFERIGQHSRAFHKTQGMGHWIPSGAERDWPLHLARATVDTDEVSIFSGLPVTLADWADRVDAANLATALRETQAHIDAALASFPDLSALLPEAIQALTHLRAALNLGANAQLQPRLIHKEQQLSQVVYLAAQAEVYALSSDVWVKPGCAISLSAETYKGAADTLNTCWDVPRGWDQSDGETAISTTADLHDGYAASYDPLVPKAPALVATLELAGIKIETRHAPYPSPVVLPHTSCEVSDEKLILNTQSGSRKLMIKLSNITPKGAVPSIDLPKGWTCKLDTDTLHITLPQDCAEGLYTVPILLDGAPAQSVERIAFDHIDPTALIRPAQVDIRVVNVALSPAKVGYIGGGHDRVGHWLAAIGCDVENVPDADLTSDAALACYDTLIIGIFALRHRPGLAEAMPALHRWVDAGGTLLTLYHRPWDNWNPDKTAPKRLEIGQPSLRWRVTDEAAAVTYLVPEHPLLTAPNAITARDWADWHKERGLYFAKSWDAAYTPLLSMADPDEAPHHGALLAAQIGAGHHIHCALILHHQMEKLTDGAFRLMANLVAKR